LIVPLLVSDAILSLRFDANDWSVAGSIGAGVEYFVAYNRALGIESKYVFEHPDVQRDNEYGLWP
jgi:hypothetical protein